MEARAVLKQIGVPATKVRQLIDLIRGKSVEEALTILRFSPRPVAKQVEKTLRSAIANGINQDEENPVDAEDLYVSSVFADEARDLKRIRPRARGSTSYARSTTKRTTASWRAQTGPLRVIWRAIASCATCSPEATLTATI